MNFNECAIRKQFYKFKIYISQKNMYLILLPIYIVPESQMIVIY